MAKLAPWRSNTKWLLGALVCLALSASACTATDPATITTASANSVNEGPEADDFSTEFDPVDAHPAPTPFPDPGPTPDYVPSRPKATPPPWPVTPTPVPSGSVPFPDPIANNCPGAPMPPGMVFVWGVADDDPDGGLIAHVEPDHQSLATRVLPPNSVVVRPTGGCDLAPNGAPWIELFDPVNERTDWVNQSYLEVAFPSCLHGEAVSSATRTGPFTDQQFGPLEGFSIIDGDRVAFLAMDDLRATSTSLNYRWYPLANAPVHNPCFGRDTPGPVCLSGFVRLFRFDDPEPRHLGDLPIEVIRTGRTYRVPIEAGFGSTFVEVIEPGADPNEPDAHAWYDTSTTRSGSTPCPNPTAPGSTGPTFAELACSIGWEGTNDSSAAAGTEGSPADHVHALRTYEGTSTSGAPCQRLVIELGTGIWSDNERPTNALPAIEMTSEATSTKFVLADCGLRPDCPAFGIGNSGAAQIEAPGLLALVTTDSGWVVRVEVLHAPGNRNTTFLENPARIVFDFVPDEPSTAQTSGTRWIHGNMVLAEHVQTDLSGPGLAANTPIEINGWGRPFEAQGQWRVYRLDDGWPDVGEPIDDVAIDELDLAASGQVRTAGWTIAWGAFTIEIPGLEPGIYAVLVGESPPIDEGGYFAVGQVIRIADPDQPATDPFPQVIWQQIQLER